MSSFSSWGPADDGRIKPDIAGNGIQLYSTMDGDDSDYYSLSGTSMSTPNVSGSLGALIQHWHGTHPSEEDMRSATSIVRNWPPRGHAMLHHLDRHAAAGMLLNGLVHRPHAAGRDHALDVEPPDPLRQRMMLGFGLRRLRDLGAVRRPRGG